MSRQRRAGAIVVMDGKTLDIEHVYVNMTMHAAMHAFMGELQVNIDSAYSDMRDELADALERYQFIEVKNVSYGRIR